MHSGKSNHRRVRLGAAKETSNADAEKNLPISPRTKKQAPSSILFQRWVLKFCLCRKTSRILLAILAISLFLLSSVYFMAPLVPHNDKGRNINHHDLQRARDNFRVRNSAKRVRSDRAIPTRDNPALPEYFENGIVYDKYEITSNVTKFANRKVFPPVEPRVVMLTDKDHSFRFAYPPGAVSGTDSSSSFPLPKERQELVANYVELAKGSAKGMTAPDSLYKSGCEPQEEWQVAYHPTCNSVHEISGGWQELYRMSTKDREKDDENREQIRLLNQGAFRHVWMVRDAHDGITKRAMKTLRSLRRKEKKFDLRNHDRHRRDAMSFEVLQESPLVVDLYASCSNTAIYDYADRGDLLGIFDRQDSAASTPLQQEEFKLHLMKIAYNVSMSVHDAHHFNERGFATMAHTDIKTDQFIYQDGYYKLSDFNRVRFLAWDPKRKKPCGFAVGKNGGEYRAPEEYKYELETEKVDVYSLGNVLYFLLVKEEVWQKEKHARVYEKVVAGQRPKFPTEILESEGIFERFMMKAIESAWIHLPTDRPSALQVANIVKEGIKLKEKSMMALK